jgi:hypothetical protein
MKARRVQTEEGVWFSVEKLRVGTGKRVYRAHVVGQLLICVFMRVTNSIQYVQLYMYGIWDTGGAGGG